jgi:hypothetical protein
MLANDPSTNIKQSKNQPSTIYLPNKNREQNQSFQRNFQPFTTTFPPTFGGLNFSSQCLQQNITKTLQRHHNAFSKTS